MHPSYYSGSAVPLSPSQQMAGYRHLQTSTPNNAGQSSLVRPPYLNVDVSPFVGMQGPHVPSPTGYPPPPFVVQRFPQYGQQNSPASGSSQMGVVSRPPPVYTGANDTVIHDQTLRSLQERVAQIAAIPRLTAQELAALNAQHITPRSVGDNRMLMQEVTHLNPPGAVRPMHHVSGAHKLTSTPSSSSLNEYLQGRLTPSERNAKIPYLTQSNAPLGSPAHGLLPMPPPPMKASSSPSSASRYIGPTEEELRKLNELMPTGDDPDSKKSVEEWKKFRLRVMSRLRKQRWRAKKKAEVLAGIEDTQREEAERKRRDRLRKQEQRAKKKQRAMEDSSSGGDDHMDSSSQRTDSPSTAPSETVSSATANACESVADQQPAASPASASTSDEVR